MALLARAPREFTHVRISPAPENTDGSVGCVTVGLQWDEDAHHTPRQHPPAPFPGLAEAPHGCISPSGVDAHGLTCLLPLPAARPPCSHACRVSKVVSHVCNSGRRSLQRSLQRSLNMWPVVCARAGQLRGSMTVATGPYSLK